MRPSVLKVSVTDGCGNAGEAGGLLELGGRIEHGDEAFDDHVIDFLLGVAEFGGLAGRDDRKVIGDLLAVENPAGFVQARAVGGSVFLAARRARPWRSGATARSLLAMSCMVSRTLEV
jgi:hypothetical protein